MSISISQKTVTRIITGTKKYSKVLADASKADINESDTVLIIRDMLEGIFGYDRYSEITTEYAIRNTYCDVAVKIDGKPRYLIEVKAINIKLNENHLRQATEYCTQSDLEYVILTNGQCWKIFKIVYKRPIKIEQIFEINWIEESAKDKGFIEKVFCLCKEGISKTALTQYEEAKQATNKFMLAAIVLGDQVLKCIKKEIKQINGFNVDIDDLKTIIREELLKREVIENEEASSAAKRYKNIQSKPIKQKEPEGKTPEV